MRVFLMCFFSPTTINGKVHNNSSEVADLVTHYRAIGDTISCDAPYSEIGCRGKLFCDTPAAIVCDTTENAV